jgi:antitoxin (DNA-binding transcriptional repressor) of toxin-antitoxin stability system
MTRTISQAELRNGSAGIMDAVQAGEDFVITRNGVTVGELRPIRVGRHLTADELVAAFADLPTGDHAAMRAEADAFFGDDDPLVEHGPSRSRG